jgi:hypothetical protein
MNALAYLVPAIVLAAACSASDTLQGLNGFPVVVEELPMTAVQNGKLSVDDLRTAVELKLRLAGVRIARSLDAPRPGHAYLYVLVTPLFHDFRWSMSASLQMKQDVLLARNRVRTIAATWERSSLSVCKGGITELSQCGLHAVQDLLDSFINDYLSVNPKK